MKIGIVGNGFVGRATYLLTCKDIEIIVYDKNPKLCHPEDIKFNDLGTCSIIFICVPTPMNKDGSCHIDIILDVTHKLKNIPNFKSEIFIRSTITPGISDKLGCHFMPEFLTEKNYVHDFVNNENWIFGLYNNSQLAKDLISKLINCAHKNKVISHNNVFFVSNKEAEMVKLFKNNFLALKVSFCNEINQYCQKKDINYETVRNLAAKDKRIGESHTHVPGPDNKYGYGGTCFPKDTNSLLYEFENMKLDSYIIKAMINRNENVDRKEADWKSDYGRTVI